MVHPLKEMDCQYIELYNRIQAFSLDQPHTQLSFSQRLAKDQGWSLEYAQRAIEEYKKFVFLAVTAGHPVSPSDQVDQVWHLHLSYTRSYWQEFCPKILQTALHHDPSRGGSVEQLKLDDWYHKTLDSYEQFFGHIPPVDIWPAPRDRFGRDLHFKRINTQQYWVLPKPNWQPWFKLKLRQVVTFPALVVLSLVVTSCQTIAQLPNPINFTGPEFLTFYTLLGAIGLLSASWLRFSLRLPKDGANLKSDLSPYEIAFLAGDRNRMVVAAVTNLVKQGYVEVVKEPSRLGISRAAQSKLIVTKVVDHTADPVEKSVAQFIAETDGTVAQVSQKSIELANVIRARLQNLGLLLNDAQALKVRLYPSLIIVSLLGLGVCKLLVGIFRDKPVFFLLMCIAILFSIGVKFLAKPHRSRYGDRIFKDLTTRLQDLRTTHNPSEAVLAVALFGVTVLTADSALANLHQMLAASTINSSGGGGDGGGGCSGGGGCGGGCGGCGGG